GGTALALGARGLWRLATEHRELGGFCVDIDYGRHPVLHRLHRRTNVGPRICGGDLRYWRSLKRFRGTRPVVRRIDAKRIAQWLLVHPPGARPWTGTASACSSPSRGTARCGPRDVSLASA